jgi:hypothetical protein
MLHMEPMYNYITSEIDVFAEAFDKLAVRIAEFAQQVDKFRSVEFHGISCSELSEQINRLVLGGYKSGELAEDQVVARIREYLDARNIDAAVRALRHKDDITIEVETRDGVINVPLGPPRWTS